MICTIACVIFGITSLLLCLYTKRIQASFPPISSIGRFFACLHLPILLALLGLTVSCKGLEIWGAILLALWFAAFFIDLCFTQRGFRRGTVLTIGDSAGCIEEDVSRRQFVASFELFGKLKKGQRIRFEVDWNKFHGVHTVNGCTYRRYETFPVRR